MNAKMMGDAIVEEVEWTIVKRTVPNLTWVPADKSPQRPGPRADPAVPFPVH